MNEEELNKKFESQTETIMKGFEKLLNMQKIEILEKVETRVSQAESKIINQIEEKDEEFHTLEERVAKLEA